MPRTFSQLLLFILTLISSISARAESEIFFDASGTDQGGFGPDQIITISGFLTFYGRSDPQVSGGIPDTFFAISDVYIIPKGYLHTAVARVPLRDVNGSPNTVLGSTGGGFFEQVIGATMPQGTLKSGEYDVVVDEHQNGFYDPAYDLHLGGEGRTVLQVLVPSDVPGLPGAGIAAMKRQATEQFDIAAKRAFDLQVLEVLLNLAQAAETGGNREELFFLLEDLLKEKFLFGQQCNDCPSGYLIAPATSAPNLMNEASALLVQMTKKYNGIAADPSDSHFAETVMLAVQPETGGRDGDALNAVTANLNRSFRQEIALADALLRALEKFQGAQQAHDGYWALAHAREIRMYATLLATQISRTGSALSAFRTAAAADSRDIDAAAGGISIFKARILDQGFSTDEQELLLGLGIPSANSGEVVQALAARNYTFSRSTFLAGLDSQITVASNAPAAYLALAASMDGIITNLLAKPELDSTQPTAAFSAPTSASQRSPVAFDASNSSDPQGLDIGMNWDFDGDGQFADGTGTNITRIFNAPFSGHVGVSVTNAADKTALAYAFLDVTSTNPPPAFTVLAPSGTAATLLAGASTNFSATATDPDGEAVQYHWRADGIEQGTGSNFVFASTPTNAGLHRISVEASDASGGTVAHTWLVSVLTPVTLVDLAVRETLDTDMPQVGKDILYTVTATNAGSHTATGVVVVLTNLLSANVAFVTSSQPLGSVVTPAPPNLLVNFGTLTNGATVSATVILHANSAGISTNTAAVSSVETELDSTDNVTGLVTRVVDPAAPVADLSVTQTASPGSATVSNVLTYTVAVRNSGPNNASGVVLTEQLAPGLVFLSATPPPSSQNGSTLTFSLGAVPHSALDSRLVTMFLQPTNASIVTSVASVAGNETDLQIQNNQASVTTLVKTPSPNVANLEIALTVSTNSVLAGGSLNYMVSVINHGPDAATGVTVVDTLPSAVTLVSASGTQGSATSAGGIVTADIGTLTNGAAAQVTIVVNTLFAAPIENRANVAGSENDPTYANNAATVNATVVNSTNGTVAIVRNFDDREITVLQTYLAEMGLVSQVFDQEGLTSNALENFKVIIWDDLSYAAGGLTANDVDVFQAAFDAHIPLYFIGDDLALSATYALEGTPEKTNWVNLIHLKATTDNYGGNRTFTIVDRSHPVVNGPYGLVGDSNYGYDPDNTTRTETGEISLGVSGPNDVLVAFKDPISKTKTVTQNILPATQTDDAGVAEKEKLFKNAVTWLLATDPVADLGLSAGTSPNPVTAGNLLTFRLTIRNTGPDQARRVIVTDTLPAGMGFISAEPAPSSEANGTLTFELGDLANANNGAVSVGITVRPRLSGTFVNTAFATYNGDDPNLTNNSASSSVTVLPPSLFTADLEASQTVSSNVVNVGGQFTYRVGVTNHGPDSAANVVLVDALPGGSTLGSFMVSQGGASIVESALVAQLGSLAPGAGAQLTLVLQASQPGEIVNFARATADAGDLNPANNSTVLQSLVLAGSGSRDEVLPYQSQGWHYKVFNPADSLPPGFEQMDFNDTAWPVGQAAFGNRGSCPLQSTVRTTWRSSTRLLLRREISLPCSVSGLHIFVAVDNDIENVFFNGVRLQTVNTHEGCPSQDDFRFDVPPELIRPGRNLVAYQALDRTGESFFDTRILADASVGTTGLSADVAVAATLPNTVTAGTAFDCTLVVTNAGRDNAGGVLLTGTLPQGAQLISAVATQGTFVQSAESFSLSLNTLTNGGTASITLKLQSGSAGTLVVAANVISGECDPDSANNQFMGAVIVRSATADLAISGNSVPGQVAPGGLANYSFLVRNNGPDTADAVTFNDALPAGLAFVAASSTRGAITHNGSVVNAELGRFGMGETATVTLVAQATGTGSLTNHATVSGLVADPNLANNVADQSTFAPDASAASDVSVSLRGPENVVAGQNARYVINVLNSGPGAVSGVVLSNIFPAGVSISGTSIPASVGPPGVLVFQLGSLGLNTSTNVEVILVARAPGTVTNAVVVVGVQADPAAGNNFATLETVVERAPAALPDLIVTIGADTNPVGLGDPMSYTITVTNRGAAQANGVILSNTLPTSATFVSATPDVGSAAQQNGTVVASFGPLAVGAKASLRIITMPTTAAVLIAKATVASTEPDANPADNLAFAAISVTTLTVAADLSLTVSATPDPVTAGSNLTYTLLVRNSGPGDASGVTITNTFASGVTFVSATGGLLSTNGILTFAIGNVPAGAANSAQFVVRPSAAGVITNLAHVYANEVDPAAANNTSLITTSVVLAPPTVEVDLALNLIAAPSPATVGAPLTYSLIVTNRSASTASSVIVTNKLPAGVNLVSVMPSQGSAVSNDREVVVSLGQISNNLTASIAIVVVPTATGVLTNEASVSSPETDTNLTNNFQILLTAVVQDTNLTVSVLSSPSLNRQTGLFEQQIRVTNLGLGTASAVRVLVFGLTGSVQLYNASGSTNGVPYVQNNLPLAAGASLDFLLECYSANRVAPTNLTFHVEQVLPTVPPRADGTILNIDRAVALAGGAMLIEFTATPGLMYAIQYSSDMQTWRTAVPVLTAPANRVQWLDNGPPKTDSPPGPAGQRYYRIVQLPSL